MHESETPDRVTSLSNWLAYSVLIPALAIFLRWLASVFLYGPANVDPLNMLRSSEVIFLAAVLVTETLSKTPSRQTSGPIHRRLSTTRGLLMVLLVFSLMVFGALTPLETKNLSGSSPSISTAGPFWSSTPQGQTFVAWFNLGLFLLVFLITLRTRWLYWKIDKPRLPDAATLQDGSEEDLSNNH